MRKFIEYLLFIVSIAAAGVALPVPALSATTITVPVPSSLSAEKMVTTVEHPMMSKSLSLPADYYKQTHWALLYNCIAEPEPDRPKCALVRWQPFMEQKFYRSQSECLKSSRKHNAVDKKSCLSICVEGLVP